jgi:hypothetical protein
VVSDAGVHVRGVLYDADISWTDLERVDVVPSSRGWQLLLLGIMRPHTLALRAGTRTLRPVGAVSTADDDDVLRAVRTIRSRAAGWLVPAQRTCEESVTPV